VNLLKKLFGHTSAPEAAVETPIVSRAGDDPFARLEWLAADTNPFGVRVLDCQPMVSGMPASLG